MDAAVPRTSGRGPLRLPAAAGESAALAELRSIAADNRIFRSFIGMGYSDTLVPGVIQRTILENPAWYTAYTPYQAEISQGRLEALLNFQTMVCDLTGLEIANASMLDEGTAAAEAMMMCHRLKESDARRTGLFRLRRLPPPDDRHRSHPGKAARDRGRHGQPPLVQAGPGMLRRARPVPGHLGRRPRLRRLLRGGPRRGRLLHRRRGPARASRS